MHMRTKVYAALPTIALGLAFAPAAFAHGFGSFGMQNPEQAVQRQAQMFQRQASALGISADVLKDGWADGKNIQDIAQAQGLTDAQIRERLLAARQAQTKAQLQAMVTSGVLTQAQADRRLQALDRLAAARSEQRGRHRGWRMRW